MSHIEDELRKKLEHHQLPNDNFDTEGLWDAISEDLGDKQPDNSGASDAMLGKSWITKFILLSIIGGIIGLVYLKLDKPAMLQENSTRTTNNINNTKQDDNKFTLTDSKENSESNTQTTDTKKVESANILSEDNLQKESSQVKNTSLSQLENHLTRTDDFSRRKAPSYLTAKVVSTDENISNEVSFENTLIDNLNTQKNIDIAKNTFPTPAIKQAHQTDIPKVSLKDILVDKLNTQKDIYLTKNTSPTSVRSITDDFSRRKAPSYLTAKVVSTDKDISNEVSFKNTLTDNCDRLPAIPVEVKSNQPTVLALAISANKNWSNKLLWTIDILGAINTVDFKFRSDEHSDLADLKKTTEKADLGTSAGINVGLLFKNQWTLSSGIEYHQLRSKLDYEKAENIQVLKQDELLTVWTDAITGDTLGHRYGDTIINAVSTRTVLHHNSYQRFSIPVEFGVLKNTEKLIYGMKVGAVFNFTNAQSGRTIDKANQVVDFTNNDTTSPFKAFDIGLRISPLIGYLLSERWSINLQPQWTWHRNTNFEDTDLKIGIHQFNMNLGLRYYIK